MNFCFVVFTIYKFGATQNNIVDTENSNATNFTKKIAFSDNKSNSMAFNDSFLVINNNKHKQKTLPLLSIKSIYNRKKRHAVDLNHMPDQNEDGNYDLVKLDPLSNPENREKIINLEAYKYNNVNYASKLHHYLQTVLPGISNLGYDEILHPNQENFDEIVRLIKMLKLKAEIAKFDAENKILVAEMEKLDKYRARHTGEALEIINKQLSDWTVMSSEKSTIIRNKIGRLKVLYDEQLDVTK